MTNDVLGNSQRPLSPGEVAFDYIKSQDFKVVWADGGIGGITPNGLIHLALYAERPAIPRRQVFRFSPTTGGSAKLEAEIVEKRISRESVVREMSCDVMLTPQAAENLAAWLLNQVGELRKLQEATGS
jgi:hypothetical protein